MDCVKCPKCGEDKCVKNGKRKGKQCYKCNTCSYQFTGIVKKIKYSKKRITVALAFSYYGLSTRIIAKLLDVKSHNTVCQWVRKYEKNENREPIEIDRFTLEQYVWQNLKKFDKKEFIYKRLIKFLCGKVIWQKK